MALGPTGLDHSVGREGPADERRAVTPPLRSRVTCTAWELVRILDSLVATLSNARTGAGQDWLRSLTVIAAEIEYGLLHRAEAGAGALVQECNELAELLRRAPLDLPTLGTQERGAAAPLEALRDQALAICVRLAHWLSCEPTPRQGPES